MRITENGMVISSFEKHACDSAIEAFNEGTAKVSIIDVEEFVVSPQVGRLIMGGLAKISFGEFGPGYDDISQESATNMIKAVYGDADDFISIMREEDLL